MNYATIEDLPPSAKLVAKVLEYEGEVTQSELVDETLLPRRTVRYALERLDEADVLEARPKVGDARQRFYSLDGDDSTSTGVSHA